MAANQRYLRDPQGYVYAWAPIIATQKNLVEVWAPDADTAATADPLLTAGEATTDNIAAMKKATLVIFADVRLGLTLDPGLTKAEMIAAITDQLSAANFTLASKGPDPSTPLTPAEAGVK